MIDKREIAGRAETYEEKRLILDKLLGAWMCSPSQRLGQLISNSLVGFHGDYVEMNLFYIEDEDLAQAVTNFISRA